MACRWRSGRRKLTGLERNFADEDPPVGEGQSHFDEPAAAFKSTISFENKSADGRQTAPLIENPENELC